MKEDIELIVIGGSSGGMSAVINIFKNIGRNINVPVVIVLHRLKDVESELAELFSSKTSLIFKEIEEKEYIEPGKIYLAPADYHVLIESDFSFALDYSAPVNYSRPSIDVLFESASGIYKNKLVGILLTGANSDGSLGLKIIAEGGGLTIVQNPEEAEFNAMPMSALMIMQPSFTYSISEIRKFISSINN